MAYQKPHSGPPNLLARIDHEFSRSSAGDMTQDLCYSDRRNSPVAQNSLRRNDSTDDSGVFIGNIVEGRDFPEIDEDSSNSFDVDDLWEQMHAKASATASSSATSPSGASSNDLYQVSSNAAPPLQKLNQNSDEEGNDHARDVMNTPTTSGQTAERYEIQKEPSSTRQRYKQSKTTPHGVMTSILSATRLPDSPNPARKGPDDAQAQNSQHLQMNEQQNEPQHEVNRSTKPKSPNNTLKAQNKQDHLRHHSRPLSIPASNLAIKTPVTKGTITPSFFPRTAMSPAPKSAYSSPHIKSRGRPSLPPTPQTAQSRSSVVSHSPSPNPPGAASSRGVLRSDPQQSHDDNNFRRIYDPSNNCSEDQVDDPAIIAYQSDHSDTYSMSESGGSDLENAARKILRVRRSSGGNGNVIWTGFERKVDGQEKIKRNEILTAVGSYDEMRPDLGKLPLSMKYRLALQKMERKTGGIRSGKLTNSNLATNKSNIARNDLIKSKNVDENEFSGFDAVCREGNRPENDSTPSGEFICKPISTSRSPSPPSLDSVNYGNANERAEYEGFIPDSTEQSGSLSTTETPKPKKERFIQYNNYGSKTYDNDETNDSPDERLISESSYEAYFQSSSKGVNETEGYELIIDDEEDEDKECYNEGWDNTMGSYPLKHNHESMDRYEHPFIGRHERNNDTDNEFGDDEQANEDSEDDEGWGDPYTDFSPIDISQFGPAHKASIDNFKKSIRSDQQGETRGELSIGIGASDPGYVYSFDGVLPMSNADTPKVSIPNEKQESYNRINNQRKQSAQPTGGDGAGRSECDDFTRSSYPRIQQWASWSGGDGHDEVFVSDDNQSPWNKEKIEQRTSNYVTEATNIDMFAWDDDILSQSKGSEQVHLNYVDPDQPILSDGKDVNSNIKRCEKKNVRDENPYLVEGNLSTSPFLHNSRLRLEHNKMDSIGGKSFRLRGPKSPFRLRKRQGNKKDFSIKNFSDEEITSDDETGEAARTTSHYSSLFGFSFTPKMRRSRKKKNHNLKARPTESINGPEQSEESFPRRVEEVPVTDLGQNPAIPGRTLQKQGKGIPMQQDENSFIPMNSTDKSHLDSSSIVTCHNGNNAILNESTLSETTQLASNTKRKSIASNNRELSTLAAPNIVIHRARPKPLIEMPPLPPKPKPSAEPTRVETNLGENNACRSQAPLTTHQNRNNFPDKSDSDHRDNSPGDQGVPEVGLHDESGTTATFHTGSLGSLDTKQKNCRNKKQSSQSDLTDVKSSFESSAEVRTKPQPSQSNEPNSIRNVSPIPEVRVADDSSTISSFQSDSLGSLVTRRQIDSNEKHKIAKKSSPKSDASQDSVLSEIERLRRENDRLRQELENVSHMSSLSSTLHGDISYQINRAQGLQGNAYKSTLATLLEGNDNSRRNRVGRHGKEYSERTRNNLEPLIKGADFDDAGSALDTITTNSLFTTNTRTQFVRDLGCDVSSAPELLKKIALTTRTVATKVKSSAQEFQNERREGEASCSRAFDCVTTCMRKENSSKCTKKTSSSLLAEESKIIKRAAGCGNKPRDGSDPSCVGSVSTASTSGGHSNSILQKKNC